MKNKTVSLIDMIKLSDNEELSESYIRYICGIELSRQYKHQEILDLKCLLNVISLPTKQCDEFIYGYVVPQLNKEFDLLKITRDACLNIELKSEEVTEEKMKRQLLQNLHYLKLLNKPSLRAFLFVSSTKVMFTLDDDNNLQLVSPEDLSTAMSSLEDSRTFFKRRLFAYRAPREY